MSSKQRYKKSENTRKKELMYSKEESEGNEGNLNSITPYRRYNLRSNSPSKISAQQLISRGNMPTNTDSKFLMNENTNKYKGRNKIIKKLSPKHSPINDKRNICLSPNKSYKLGKNVSAKSQLRKCLQSPTLERKSICEKSEEDCFDRTNMLTAPKSILRRAPVSNSPLKYPNIGNTDDKEIIKDRIYGAQRMYTSARQKRVNFKTTSSSAFEGFTFSPDRSKDLKNNPDTCDEQNISILKGNNKGAKRIKEPVSEANDDGSIQANIMLKNDKASSDKKSFETIKAIIDNENEKSFEEDLKLSQKGKESYIKSPTNTPNNSDESKQIRGLFNQNCIKAYDVDYEVGNISNERESSEEKLLDMKTNNAGVKVENVRHLNYVETTEIPLKKNSLQEEKIIENSEASQNCKRHGFQDKISNFLKEDISNIKEVESYEDKSSIFQDMCKNSIQTTLLPFSTLKTPDRNHANVEHTKSKDLLKNEVENKLKNLTAIYLQEIKKKRIIKQKRLPKKSNENSKNTNYTRCNVAQATNDSENEFLLELTNDKNPFLMDSAEPSNAEDLKTSQKVSTLEQKPKNNLNLSNIKSPKTSKIPRLMQILDNASSPVPKIGFSPIKTKRIIGSAHNQNNLKCAYDSEDEVKKTENLDEGILIPVSRNLSIEEQENGSIAEITDIHPADSFRVSTEPSREQDNNIILQKNKNILGTNSINVNYTDNNELKLVDNTGTCVRAWNNNFKQTKEDKICNDEVKKDSGMKKKPNKKSYKASASLRGEISKKAIMEKIHSRKNKTKVKVKIPVFKRKKYDKKCVFVTTVFMSVIFFMLLFKMFDPTCDA